MKRTTLLPLLLASSLSSACSQPPTVAGTSAPLTLGLHLDARAGAQIVGASPDRRRIVWAAPCDQSEPSLWLYDAATGRVRTLGTLTECRPDGVQFSSDGELAAFPASPGVAMVWSARSGALVSVSRADAPTVGVSFSPDARWLVVASELGGAKAALDAWDADLVHHVELAAAGFFVPFGPATQSLQFSADGKQLLFVGDVTTFPIGTLELYDHDRGTTTTLARGVAAWKGSADLTHIAFLDGVTYQQGPPSQWLHGRLATIDRGRLRVIADDIAAAPQLFAPDGTLVYLVGVPGGPSASMTLASAAPDGGAVTLDDHVFQGFAPAPSVALARDGRSLAYLTAFDAQHFSGALHVTTLPPAGAVPSPPSTVASDAAVGAFGWVGGALVYLHAPTSGWPFAAVGTLAAWTRDGRSARIADDVTQVGLQIDDAVGRALFVAAWDAPRDVGELSRWSARTGRVTPIVADALPLSTQLSPDGTRAGVFTVGPATATTPPVTTLWLAPLSGGAAKRVADGVTSFVVADAGLSYYTNSDGVFVAFTF